MKLDHAVPAATYHWNRGFHRRSNARIRGADDLSFLSRKCLAGDAGHRVAARVDLSAASREDRGTRPFPDNGSGQGYVPSDDCIVGGCEPKVVPGNGTSGESRGQPQAGG